MSRGYIGGLFGPDVPAWACEISSRRAVVVRASDDRRTVRARAEAVIGPGVLVPGLRENNIRDTAALRGAVGRALEAAGFSGSEIALVLPDDAVRVALIEVESFPSSEDEQLAFIRWKFRKNVPFDVGSARVTWEKVTGEGAVRLMAALAPDGVVRPYEEALESFGLHAGLIAPSTVALLGLAPSSEGDVLVIKKGDTSITTSVLSGGRMRFYRMIAARSLYEAAYPTFVYYQDKLGGKGLGGMIVCGEDIDPAEAAELEQGIGGRAEKLLPAELEDIYKPALGALQ